MEFSLLISLGIIAILLVLSAFFSGAETALTAVSRPLIHQLERKGNRRAGLVNMLRKDKERLIGAILLGNNVVNILASVLATSILIGLYGEAGVIYATVAMTLLVVIFAEILPKTYAIQNANRMSLAVAPLVRSLVILLSPIVLALRMFVRILLRLFGIDMSGDRGMTMTVEELHGAIALHTGEDPGIRHERAMLHSILELADVEVGEITVHRKDVVMLDADEKPEALVAQVVKSPYTRLPLWRDKPENIIGVLHAKAVLQAVHDQAPDGAAPNLLRLAAKPWFIPESTSLLHQLQAFRQRREHFALVVDEYGALMGIVTLEDILEEIVGDIADEHDVTAPPGVRLQRDGSAIVEGTFTIRDLNRRFDWRLPDEDAATIAGLLLHEAREIPTVGQVFEFHDFRFEVLHRTRNQITSIRVTPPKGLPGPGPL
ncbi:MAG: HlyC/CorC family transporter [Proteobacteria bacterium]|nr:HlyC/CorC family transporter [Pseudomonadota bacterium]